ncbi:LapA family protein [Rhodococcus spongiicola]|nr:lipopolysaccharide assembly protein LapA domain-containing protein [Rhodococcus spongiicola]
MTATDASQPRNLRQYQIGGNTSDSDETPLTAMSLSTGQPTTKLKSGADAVSVPPVVDVGCEETAMNNPVAGAGPEPGNEQNEDAAPPPRGSNLVPTRAGMAWTAVAVGAIIVVGMLIFILQNTEEIDIAFLGWNFTLPLGVALLFAAIGGLLVMAFIGGARIWQLRNAYKSASAEPSRRDST